MFKNHNTLLATTALIAIATHGIATAAASPAPLQHTNVRSNQNLVAGTQEAADLPTDGSTTFTLEFTNKTEAHIYDLLLDTDDSSGIDPDFEGAPVRVFKKDNAGTWKDLGWGNSPSHGDGVEDMKVMAPNIDTRYEPDEADAIPPGEVFRVEITSADGFFTDDVLEVTPTTKGTLHAAKWPGIPICFGFDLPHPLLQNYQYYNGHEGLSGRSSGYWEGTNGLGSDCHNVSFSSPSPGIYAIDAYSSHPSTFDPLNGILTFTPPIPPGAAFDYSFIMNDTEPYLESDPDPTTVYVAELNVSVQFQLSVSGLVGGSTATFSMSNGIPGGMVALAYSLAGGGPTALVGGPCPGLVVDLSNPMTVIGMLPSDGSGNAAMSMGIPSFATGIMVWMQAVDLTSCTASNQVAQVIQ